MQDQGEGRAGNLHVRASTSDARVMFGFSRDKLTGALLVRVRFVSWKNKRLIDEARNRCQRKSEARRKKLRDDWRGEGGRADQRGRAAQAGVVGDRHGED